MRVVLLAVAALLAVPCARGADPPPKPAAPGMGLTGVLDEEGFKALHQLRQDHAPALHGTMVTVGKGKAYLSLPKSARAPLPAVVVVHEWWGLNEHVKHWADRLAADGYAALAVDLFGGEVADTPDRAMELVKAVDQAAGIETIGAGLRFLAGDPRAGARRRAVMGWCFGGGWALQSGLRLPDQVDAVVLYYGRLVTDPAELAPLRAPLLGVFGNLDRGIPPDSVDAFEAGLKAAGKSCSIQRYDAPHAFANPSNAAYDPKAAGDAWEKVRAFLARRLK